MKINKRKFLLGGACLSATTLAGCSITPQVKLPGNSDATPVLGGNYSRIYGAVPEERFPLPAIKIDKIPRKFLRQQVSYSSKYPIGTIVVDTNKFFLHLVQEGSTAIRYGVGLGRQGFSWSGDGIIQWKQKWPKWTPPSEMIERQPELEKWSAENGGMPPGLDNPLGARALYIFQDGKDTLYRIHGSPEYWTIGKAVSSGCVRMINQDIVDLYDRVPNKSRLIVV